MQGEVAHRFQAGAQELEREGLRLVQHHNRAGDVVQLAAAPRPVAPRVRVNVLAPGWIETAYGTDVDDTIRRQVVATTPLERWGTPEDVAAAAVYLASPTASFVTGQVMLVGGGVVM